MLLGTTPAGAVEFGASIMLVASRLACFQPELFEHL
jgi:hypothetical protein